MLEAVELRSLLDYEPETGIFRWKWRDGVPAIWNEKNAGKVAGTRIGDGYVGIRIRSRPYYAHRLAWLYMTGEWPADQIDHCQGKSNRWANLREATCAQNQRNRSVTRRNKLGIKGVFQRDGVFIAKICKDRVIYKLGRFETAEAASAAYAAAARDLHGEFARVA